LCYQHLREVFILPNNFSLSRQGGHGGVEQLTEWQSRSREIENACVIWPSPFSAFILSRLPAYGMVLPTLILSGNSFTGIKR
jgi:hypothetical protein